MTIPTVSNGDDILTSWGNAVAGQLNKLPAAIAAGSVGVSFTATDNATATITFPAGRFAGTPFVVATVNGVAGLAGSTIRVDGVSSSGATIRLTLTSSQTAVHQVNWIAVA